MKVFKPLWSDLLLPPGALNVKVLDQNGVELLLWTRSGAHGNVWHEAHCPVPEQFTTFQVGPGPVRWRRRASQRLLSGFSAASQQLPSSFSAASWTDELRSQVPLLVSSVLVQLIFEAVRSGFDGRIAIDDVSFAKRPCSVSRLCSFEGHRCGYQSYGNVQWLHRSAHSGSGSGPRTDHTLETQRGDDITHPAFCFDTPTFIQDTRT